MYSRMGAFVFSSMSFCFMFLTYSTSLVAQQLVQMSSYYDDYIGEWRLVYDDEELFDGTLRPTFGGAGSTDVSHWTFEYLDSDGQISQKIRGVDQQWDYTDDIGNQISIRQVWPGDRSIWRVTSDSISIEIKPRFGLQADEWLYEGEHGSFYMYTQWEGDPRDWTIESYLKQDVPKAFDLALAFIIIYISSPISR